MYILLFVCLSSLTSACSPSISFHLSQACWCIFQGQITPSAPRDLKIFSCIPSAPPALLVSLILLFLLFLLFLFPQITYFPLLCMFCIYRQLLDFRICASLNLISFTAMSSFLLPFFIPLILVQKFLLCDLKFSCRFKLFLCFPFLISDCVFRYLFQ